MKKAEIDKLVTLLESGGYEVCALQEGEYDSTARAKEGKTLYVRVLVPFKKTESKD